MANNNIGDDLGYHRFAHFIHNSLEVYRPQLTTLLFPLFAHIYMKLTATGHLKAAQQLLQQHGDEHEHMFASEMSQLRLMVDKESMKKVSYAKNILRETNSFVLTIGKTAQTLLSTFLEENKLEQILHILNSRLKLNTEYIHPSTTTTTTTTNTTTNTNDNTINQSVYGIDTSESASSSSSSSSSIGILSGSGMTGVNAHELKQINQIEIDWGVVSKRPRTNVMEQVQDIKLQMNEFIASEEKIKPVEKKRKIRQFEININEKEKEARRPKWIGTAGPPPCFQNNEFYRDMVEKLRLRIKPIQKKQEELDDVACVQLGYWLDHQETKQINLKNDNNNNDNNESTTATNNNNHHNNNNQNHYSNNSMPTLPSIACLSLKNNYDALSCTKVSRDSVQIVGGYSDGIVRVWRLDGKTHLGETYGFVPSKEDSPLATFNGSVESSAHLVGHTMGVTSCAFMPDNEWLLSCSEDR